MADYYPLLARALDGLTDTNREARVAVYDRARTALRSQLGSIVPPLGPSEIDRECASLDEAIDRIERQQAADHRAPANEAVADANRDDLAAERPDVEGSSRAQNGQPAIRRGGRRNRSLLTAAVLVVAITPIAVAAWLWRDQPVATPASEPPRSANPQPSANDPKFPERMAGQGTGSPAPRPAPPAATGGPSPTTAQPAAPAPPRPDPTPTAAPSPAANGPTPAAQPATAPVAAQQPEIAVAQRAALIEENTADPQQPKVTPGRALWRLDAVNSGQGQLLETVVRATIDVPDAKLSLSLLLRRNRDAALPASHTLELTFTTATAGEDARVVRDVNPPLVRPDDSARGVPLAALSVPVKENVFLIGLSNLRSDIDRNTDLLVNRNWIELPVRFGSGARATLVFEKGVTGDRVVADAFKQWAQQ